MADKLRGGSTAGGSLIITPDNSKNLKVTFDELNVNKEITGNTLDGRIFNIGNNLEFSDTSSSNASGVVYTAETGDTPIVGFGTVWNGTAKTPLTAFAVGTGATWWNGNLLKLDADGDFNVARSIKAGSYLYPSNGGVRFPDTNAYWLSSGASNNWGLYWNTTANKLQFMGSGNSIASVDLGNGNIWASGNIQTTDYIYASGNLGASWDTNVNTGLVVKASDGSKAYNILRVDTDNGFKLQTSGGTQGTQRWYTNNANYIEFSGTTIKATLNGNASTSTTATKLKTARSIALSGDATGSISFDGSSNKTLTVVVKDDSHSHSKYAQKNIAEETFDGGVNTTLNVLSDNGGASTINLMGGDQGTGKLFVGQSSTHGGGLEYNGDNTPTTTGAGADYLTLYRRSGGTDSWTARSKYDSNNWEFRGDIKAASFTGDLNGNSSTSDFSTKINVNTSINATNWYEVMWDNGSDTIFGTPDITIQPSTKSIRSDRHYFGGTGQYLKIATGNYGSIETRGRKGGFGGYSIEGRVNFMHDGSNTTGLYNDVNNEWLFKATHNAGTELYYNGASKLVTTNSGISVSGITTINDVIVGGMVRATGDVQGFYSSDERIKKHIVEIADPLEKVSNWRSVTYEKLIDGKYQKETGLIAQDIEKDIPDLIEEKDDIKRIRTGGNEIIAHLVGAIKELKREIDELKRK